MWGGSFIPFRKHPWWQQRWCTQSGTPSVWSRWGRCPSFPSPAPPGSSSCTLSRNERRSDWMVRFCLVISIILNFILLQMVVTPWAGQLPFLFTVVDGPRCNSLWICILCHLHQKINNSIFLGIFLKLVIIWFNNWYLKLWYTSSPRVQGPRSLYYTKKAESWENNKKWYRTSTKVRQEC